MVQVHAFAEGSEEAERMLLFRDRLRSDDGDRALYEETMQRGRDLRRTAASLHPRVAPR